MFIEKSKLAIMFNSINYCSNSNSLLVLISLCKILILWICQANLNQIISLMSRQVNSNNRSLICHQANSNNRCQIMECQANLSHINLVCLINNLCKIAECQANLNHIHSLLCLQGNSKDLFQVRINNSNNSLVCKTKIKHNNQVKILLTKDKICNHQVLQSSMVNNQHMDSHLICRDSEIICII